VAPRRFLRLRLAALVLGVLSFAPGSRGDEPVVTTLADYEDDSVAATIEDVQNVLETDCSAGVAAIPARGQRSLVVEIGATKQNASVACDLRFRLATPFQQADRVATYAWIVQGAVDVAFRVRDATGRVFETPPLLLKTQNRWVRLVADLRSNQLEPAGPRGSPGDLVGSKPTWPIEVQGYRIRTHEIGRQTVYLDDLQVEHRVFGADMLRGEFKLDQPTHIYPPGTLVRAALVLENISRERALPLSVQMAWLRSDGSELTTASAPINLPASGADYRSRQPVDFSQRIVDPGLYRLVARVRGPRWTTPAVFETTIAVTHSNRALPRGRATFFGVQTNLIREPAADQLLEIEIAREIGVQLLALETPWRIIEPRPGAFEFGVLDALITGITRRDIAAMVVLTEPPDWLAAKNADYWNRQTELIEALVRRYQERIFAYQPLSIEPGRLSPADVSALVEIRRRVTALRPNIEICTPPIRVSSDDPSAAVVPTLPPGSGLELAFETTGDLAAAAPALETFARQNNLEWTPQHRWFHRAEPLTQRGAMYDAVAILHHYVRAARVGVAGVVWYDLRDDTNDPRFPELMRGLVQRDFSPKSPLLGLANAVGMLYGLLFAGDVPGAPAEFDSALFIGGQRQVAVLCPKPNRVLPAVLAPYHTVEGELAVFDFDRRLRPLTISAAPPLTQTDQDPFFITLAAVRAQADPKIGLARPWLRAPAAVYCGSETTFTIELDAPMDLRRSYLQVILPSDAAVRSSISSRALRAEAGQTISFDVTLTRTTDEVFEPVPLTVRLRLEGTALTVPVTVHPLLSMRRMKPSQKISDASFGLGRLAPVDSEHEESRPATALHAAYENHTLHVAIALPSDVGPDATLDLGLAVAGADTHAEARIEHLTGGPKLVPDRGTTSGEVEAWRCHLIEDEQARIRLCDITIPSRAMGLSGFEPGTRILLAARYVEPQPGDWTLPRILEWGHGLGGERSTSRYHWVELAHAPPD
jgi:hypothetical protein